MIVCAHVIVPVHVLVVILPIRLHSLLLVGLVPVLAVIVYCCCSCFLGCYGCSSPWLWQDLCCMLIKGPDFETGPRLIGSNEHWPKYRKP